MKMKYLAVLLAVSAVVHTQPGSYSYFCCFKDDPTEDYYYTDGCYFGGPFRANGSVWVASTTPGRDDDPWFYSFTLSSDHYLAGMSATPVSVPHWEELWIEPYELMEQGAPWFNLDADSLAFGPDDTDWQSVRTTAFESGLVLSLPDEARILIDNGQIHILDDPQGTTTLYDLNLLSEPVIWIENAPSDRVYIKGYPDVEIEEELTIGAYGSFFFSGPLEYSPIQPGMLGLISVYGDGVIADDPEIYEPWPQEFHIETDEDFTFSASILLLGGKLFAERYWEPDPQVDFSIAGGVQMQHEGYTGTGGSHPLGFNIKYLYDSRLLTDSPPHYPTYQLSGIDPEGEYLSGFLAYAAFNPFSASTVVHCSQPASVRIYDQTGRVVCSTATDGEFTWSDPCLPSGVYILRAVSDNGICRVIRLVKLM